ncbi:hypothetical protein J437_LFUL000742 [Ladona fulva]|uniref:HMG box domain-containing protein n=1 Tax=Ladona fulva TaxID=123851 RepID=A0A8K0JTI7_LADFU|nr:hypothetical protein J437_LFUL000742 [Ladona fulva]
MPEGMKIQMHYDTDPSPLLPKMIGDPEGMLMDDSLDGGTGTGPPSVGSGDLPAPVPIATPTSGKKKASSKKQVVTGYILYSGDVRRGITAKYPDSSFGEISRIVGNEWRNLGAQEKQMYEEKAARMNEENAAKLAATAAAAAGEGGSGFTPSASNTSLNQSLQHQQDSSSSSSPAPMGTPGGLPGGCPGGGGAAGTNTAANGTPVDAVFECLWDHCDWQFEDQTDLIDHCIQEPNGHVHQYFQANPDAEFQCQWKGCGRLKKQAAPFPSVQRLARHVKEVHIHKGNGRSIAPHDRSRNFVASRRQLMTPTRHFTPASTYGNYQMQSPHSHHSPFAHAISGLLVPGGGGGTGAQGQPGHPVPPHLLNSSNSNSSNSSAFSRQTPSPLAHGTVVSSTGSLGGACATTHLTTTARPMEPIFVSVPPRPQRLLHSEAYIKYIEGLQADNKYISQWERHLKATPENTRSVGAGGEGALGRLPGHWLANGAGDHGSILNALWTLRDFMLRDALNISRMEY